ncbi:hypothetical protein [Roseateles sp. P5_D6]
MSWQPARRSLLGRVAIAGFVVVITALVFRLGISIVSPAPQGDEREAEELNVYEAVLRYQFLYNASAQRADAKVYCLTVARLDPDDAFLRRFAGHHVPVKNASACNINGHGVFDRATGALGLELHVDTVTWVSGQEVTVSGGYFEGSLSASSNVYRLRKKDHRWTVVGDRLHLIS